MILIPATVIVILMMMKEPQNGEAALWLSWKIKMERSLIVMKGSGCMLSSKASGMTTLTPIAPLITGHLQVPLFVTSSEMYSKKNFHFYVFVLGNGRLRHYGRRITTAGSGPYWLGRLGRHCWFLEALIVATSASERSLWNLQTPRAKLRCCSMHLNQKK